VNQILSRSQALDLLQQHVRSPNLIKHSLASEAVMRALAERLGANPEVWGLAGLLHDLDVEATASDLARHTHRTVEILRGLGIAEDVVEAIRLHNEMAHSERRSAPFHHALAASETITGLILATALVYPDKKLASVQPKSVRKRMKEKAFAAGADRGIILECERLGIGIDEFCALALAAMQSIAGSLDPS
jgi:uncharacterized protein